MYDHAIAPAARTVDPSIALTDTSSPGDPIAEREHHDQLRRLWTEEGAAAVFAAGFRVGRHGRGPLIDVLASSADVIQLVHRYARLEPMFHMGHRCVVTATSGAATVRHVARVGTGPHVADSVFVCAAFVGMSLRIGTRGLTVSIVDDAGHEIVVWPRTSINGLVRLTTPLRWNLGWPSSRRNQHRAPDADRTADALRALVVASPERQWSLASVAAELHLSTRTMQRRMISAGTTTQRTIIDGRVDAALGWLCRTDVSATTIAHICGFADLSHLSREVRRRHGMPPGTFRRRFPGQVGV